MVRSTDCFGVAGDQLFHRKKLAFVKAVLPVIAMVPDVTGLDC